MRDKDRRPAFDAREYFRIGCWREPARPQHRNAIGAIHLDLRRVAKVRADRRRERDETTRRKQRHAANQRWLIDCQTAGDPVAEGVSDVDASMLRQSRLPLFAAHGARLPCRAEDASRDPASVPKLPEERANSAQIRAVRCSGKWLLSLARTGLHPQKAVGPKQRQ